MSPSCDLSHQCQGPRGSGLLTLHPWASSFPSNVEFCPAQALPDGRRRRAGGGSTCSTAPAKSPCVPHGQGTELGYPWRCPEWLRTAPGASSSAGGGGPEGTRRSPGPFSSPEQPFSPHPAPEDTAPPAPGLLWRLLELGFPAETGDKLPWFASGLTPCPRLGQGAPAVSLRARMAPTRLEALPKRIQEPPLPPCPCAAGGHRQLLSLAWSSSTRCQTSPGRCCPRDSLPAGGRLGMAVPGTSLSANVQWQSWEPALAFPCDPDTEYSSLPALPSLLFLPPLCIFSFPLWILTRQQRGCSVPRTGGW